MLGLVVWSDFPWYQGKELRVGHGGGWTVETCDCILTTRKCSN